ncbi:MAG TPA: metallophosphoesterase [Thermohalobaculum sp.]|nr:metallophosphoesterase [Thermohalobaculum sp.]
MLGFLFGRKQASGGAVFDAPLASAGPVYAVGDVHGRADLLARLLARIDEDRAARGGGEVVFLGDYIDRGDQSREVLDLVVGRAAGAEPPVCLMGNHERMLLDFVDEPESGRRWLRFGGLQTLMSYGVKVLGQAGDLTPARDALVEAMGPHLAFLKSRLDLSHRSGNVLFVHAAADPAAEPGNQPEETLLWGAPGFESTPRADGVWVVHGHTVVSSPRAVAGRIAVDTGAYFSGRLTAARIDGAGLDFFST